MLDNPFPPFETARLLLRCVGPDDAAATPRIESLRLRAVERSAIPLAAVEP